VVGVSFIVRSGLEIGGLSWQHPPSQQWVDGLNVIDVVFADVPQVVELWHRYYEALANHPANDNYQN
jgi:hypothetical protein